MAGITRTVSSVDEARPKRREIASPWKMGSVRMTPAPIMAAAAKCTVAQVRETVELGEPKPDHARIIAALSAPRR